MDGSRGSRVGAGLAAFCSRPPAPAPPAGDHTITAADPLPDDRRGALDRIHQSSGAH